MSATQKSPQQLREEIEEARQALGDTVEALAGRADVKARVREAMPGSVQEGLREVKRRPAALRVLAAIAAGVFIGWRLARR
jgi:hypothetical protein